jgi:aminoglycoside phosphotransferase (APT) family kinase protein
VNAEFRAADQVAPQDWRAIGAWLASFGHHLDDDVPRQFESGLANLNYLVSVDGTPVVFRRPPDGPTGEGSNDMGREWTVLNGLAGHFPLAPGPVAFCDDTAVIGVPFQQIEYRPGTSVGSSVPAEVRAAHGEETGRHLTTQLLRTMVALHAVDPGATPLRELGRPEGFLGRQVEGWARRSATAFGEAEPAAVGAIVERLRSSVPPESRHSLLHCDLKFDNVLFDLDELRPVAVVDWDMATRGDPLFDLAVLLSYWVEPGDPAPLHALDQVPSLEPGFPSRAEVAAEYLALAGATEVDLSFHLVLARFRLAVAWQQMYVKYERGALRDPRYRSFHALATAVLEWTADTVADPE